jgi:hypothetical protein
MFEALCLLESLSHNKLS